MAAETKTVGKCLKENKAKFRDRELVDCFNKENCEHKLSFGNGYFCRKSPLYDKPVLQVV